MKPFAGKHTGVKIEDELRFMKEDLKNVDDEVMMEHVVNDNGANVVQ